jgi:hypothetical protein
MGDTDILARPVAGEGDVATQADRHAPAPALDLPSRLRFALTEPAALQQPYRIVRRAAREERAYRR